MLYIGFCYLVYHLIYHRHPSYFTTHRIILFFWEENCHSLKFLNYIFFFITRGPYARCKMFKLHEKVKSETLKAPSNFCLQK